MPQPAPLIDPDFRQYATARQVEIIEAVLQTGSSTAAAELLGINRSNVSRAITAVEARAARLRHLEERRAKLVPSMDATRVTDRYDADGGLEGFSVEQRPASEDGIATPDAPLPGFVYKRISTLYDRASEKTLEWQIQSPERRQLWDMIQHAVEGLRADIVPVAPLAAPTHVLAHLLTLYTFTDYHVGMLAWHREGGADWDVKIAEDLGTRAMQAMVAGAPAADTAVVNIQGDFLHWDGLLAVTPTHGHVLDADSRFGRVVDVAIRLIRRLVALALTKHQNVILMIVEGNHDLASSLWLRKLFAALYEVEPRVTVHDSELPYYAIEWGQTMLGFHHGHLKKNEALPALFAAQFRPMWGRCPKVYIHVGHRHHKDEKEHPGCFVIQHPTLAARDAHAARGGWWSERAIKAITYHREFGEAGTLTVTPEMLG